MLRDEAKEKGNQVKTQEDRRTSPALGGELTPHVARHLAVAEHRSDYKE